MTMQDPSQENQVPIVEVNRSTGTAYFENAYTKPVWACLALKDLLGPRLFSQCVQGYIAQWHGHHPIPWDFFHAFNTLSGQDLDWFWNSWFFSHGYNDLGIGEVTKSPSGYAVNINNVGGFDIPFDIKVRYRDGSTGSLHETPVVWKQNQRQTTINIETDQVIQSLAIDNGIWMDANKKDNVWAAN